MHCWTVGRNRKFVLSSTAYPRHPGLFFKALDRLTLSNILRYNAFAFVLQLALKILSKLKRKKNFTHDSRKFANCPYWEAEFFLQLTFSWQQGLFASPRKSTVFFKCICFELTKLVSRSLLHYFPRTAWTIFLWRRCSAMFLLAYLARLPLLSL